MNKYTLSFSKDGVCYKCGPIDAKVFLNWFSVQYDEILEMLNIAENEQ